MFCSVFYHLFGCISSRACAEFLKLDYCGIGLGILGCYLCGLHISFECYRDWRIRYEILIIAIMIIAVIYYVHGVQRYIKQNLHVALFIIIALLGFFPGFHWYYLHGGWTNGFVQEFFPKLFVLYGILGLGTIVYLIKLPERFFPGNFEKQDKFISHWWLLRLFWIHLRQPSNLASLHFMCLCLVVSKWCWFTAISSE